ncbi:MAG: aldehyde dehydrogenase family protein, partial [Chitinophagales bacterium]
SEVTKNTSAVLENIINKNFPAEYLKVIETDATGTQQLLKEKFDFIFFTGGTKVGQIVYEAAAKHLTPVALELGGKSPCLVDENVNLEIAAKRISWGKYMNAGQICVTPDYCLVHKNIKEKFILEIQKNIEHAFGTDAQQSTYYGRIVNDAHVNRIEKLLSGVKIIHGGKIDKPDRYIEPTILEVENISAPIMQEEIFGPLLPIISYTNIDEAINIIQKNPDPLVLYVYTNNRNIVKKLMQEVKAGDMCVNENILHFGQVYMPIGGVGASGIGKYQGRNSFTEFSHKKSVLDKKFFPDFTFRYPPYTEFKFKQLKFFFRNFWG